MMDPNATDEQSIALRAAMARAFGAMQPAMRTRVNPHFRTRYADLGDVLDAIRPALIANGLWVSQSTEPSDGGVTVETVLYHAAGGRESLGKLFVPATKSDPQAYGSALSYARRYALQCAFAVPATDDDGERAGHAQQIDAEMLAAWRAAAARGTDALQAAFRETTNSESKAATWAAHQAELKAGAGAVDRGSAT
ncbi:MAG: ERF family protein [Gemmatimonadaceae bacterium]|nr:ERF family protein [Gemmatimonadaceae bacterium]